MILNITNRCQMGCYHCMENATPDGDHMTLEIFEQPLDFIDKIKPKVLLVSGGEPLEHPDFFHIMDKLLERFSGKQIVLTSNGMFLDNKELRDRVLKLGVLVQITNDPRYYPKRINMNIKHPSITYATRIESLYPQGRAIHKKPINCKAPKCFNLRSIARSRSNMVDVIECMEELFKFCTPMIGATGHIYPGESKTCKNIGNVYDSLQQIHTNLIAFRCNDCKMFNNIPVGHRKHVGED